MSKIDKVVEVGDQMAEAQAKHLAAMAEAASGAIRADSKSDMLQLIGAVSGSTVTAVDLLCAIRDQMQ